MPPKHMVQVSVPALLQAWPGCVLHLTDALYLEGLVWHAYMHVCNNTQAVPKVTYARHTS